MPTDHRTVSFTSALIIMGGYQFPVAVALGALTGASIFMISATGYTAIQKLALFIASLMTGFFVAEDINPVVNALLPEFLNAKISLGPFLSAAIAAAVAVTVLQIIPRFIEKAILNGGPKP